MQATFTTERTLTQSDHARLARLLRQHGPAAALQDLLDTSELVASRAVPPTVVTMYSQVLLQDPAGDAPPYKLAICLPDDAEPGAGFVSVLSPLGTALLGLPVGETARWKTPHGAVAAARILSVLFQPEATGDYET